MKIVVIGAVATGTSVLAKARRNREDIEIVSYTASKEISYSACGIPYFIGDEEISRKKLTPRDVNWFKERFNIDIFTSHRVEKIFVEEKKILIKNENTGEKFFDNFDKLVISTGSRAKELKFKNENIFYVKNLEDADRIKQFINTKNPETALIIGGGAIGIEMIDNLATLGIKTTLIEKSSKIAGLDEDITQYIINYLNSYNIEVILEDFVTDIENNRVKTSKGKDIEADIIIGAIGVTPNTEFLKDSGIELNKIGAVKVNEYLETNIKDIYSGGDCATSYSLITGEELYLPLGSTANKMGRIIGDRIAGGDLEFKGVLGTSIFKIFNLTVGKTGLSQEEAEKRGYNVEVIHNIKPNQSEYIKTSKEMLIKAVADKTSGKLLGVQIIGENGVDKRLDIFVTLLSFGATIEQLFHLDLAYAPPFSTTKDPVIYTGMILDNAINGKNKIILPETLRNDILNYLVIDVRSKEQYDKGHIDKAVNIPLERLRDEISNLSKDKKIVVYCNKGTTGNMAQNILINNGYEVYNLSGGYTNYSKNLFNN